MEHTRRFGTRFEQLARGSVKTLRHSTMNPKAMYQVETPLETVMQAAMIARPNTRLMCSVNVDGAAPVVLASETRARQPGMGRAVRISASIPTSDPLSPRNPALPHFNTCTQNDATLAYETAGLAPEALDPVELHDGFATAELLHYENLGICNEGEAGKTIENDETSLGGRLRASVSGGLLSNRHPAGATGVANLPEVVSCLRGGSEAGDRQVEGAAGLTHVVGVGKPCSIHGLERAAQ